MIEQAGQYSQRVGVIFDDQNSQAPAPWRQSFCWIAAHWTWLARIFSGSLQQKSHRKWTLLSKQKSHVPLRAKFSAPQSHGCPRPSELGFVVAGFAQLVGPGRNESGQQGKGCRWCTVAGQP